MNNDKALQVSFGSGMIVALVLVILMLGFIDIRRNNISVEQKLDAVPAEQKTNADFIYETRLFEMPKEFKVIFHNNEYQIIGELIITTDCVTFEGNADESAEMFFEYLQDDILNYMKGVRLSKKVKGW